VLWSKPKFPLRARGSDFRLEAVNKVGHTVRHDIVVSREMQKARQLSSRLRVIHMPFDMKGAPFVLTATVYDSLFDAFVS
jgi:hypothetical protein